MLGTERVQGKSAVEWGDEAGEPPDTPGVAALPGEITKNGSPDIQTMKRWMLALQATQ
jgi:hypothetical protein